MAEDTATDTGETASIMPMPTRRSIDWRRTQFKRRNPIQIEAFGTDAFNPREIAADNIDGTEEEERRRLWVKQLSAFLSACPEKLRDALQRALTKPGRITKCDLAKDAGISRPTLDRWLELASSATWGTSRPPFGRIAI